MPNIKKPIPIENKRNSKNRRKIWEI